MTESQTRILSFINIHCFSDDIRLLILDYLYFRGITKLSNEYANYYLRLGVGLESDKLCMQMTVYDHTSSYVLSSFGINLEGKAIKEYNFLKEYIPTLRLMNWDQVFMNSIGKIPGFHHRRYAFCPKDESTIMIQLKIIAGYFIEIHLYSIHKIETKRIAKCIRTHITWKSEFVHHSPFSEKSEEHKKQIINYQKLVSEHGNNWKNYDKSMLMQSAGEYFSETVWIFSSSYTKEN